MIKTKLKKRKRMIQLYRFNLDNPDLKALILWADNFQKRRLK